MNPTRRSLSALEKTTSIPFHWLLISFRLGTPSDLEFPWPLISSKAAMGKKGKEERGVLMAGRRGSGSQPEERGSRPQGEQRRTCERGERARDKRAERPIFPQIGGLMRSVFLF
jgi:hypothetical protein